LTTLYTFYGNPGGTSPGGRLVQATDGNFYGTTSGMEIGDGTVFKITPGGNLTTLHTFDFIVNPGGGLVQATDGNLYGTTNGGATGTAAQSSRLPWAEL
jgi:uncharacterized repeat protein (TIGR03803 family)